MSLGRRIQTAGMRMGTEGGYAVGVHPPPYHPRPHLAFCVAGDAVVGEAHRSGTKLAEEVGSSEGRADPNHLDLQKDFQKAGEVAEMGGQKAGVEEGGVDVWACLHHLHCRHRRHRR